MDEVVAGLDKPLTTDELKGLMGRYLEDVPVAEASAATLRTRIAKGRSLIASGEWQDGTDEMTEAISRIEELERELRGAEWTVLLGSGFAFAYALHASIEEVCTNKGWKPPEGSVARIRMPGICNLSVSLAEVT